MKIMALRREFSSIQELQNIIDNCFTRTELANQLGINFFNGKVSKKITELVEEFNLNIDHFDPTIKNKQRRLFLEIEKSCPVCGSKFITQEGHPKETTTCSYSCSNVYFADLRHTEESNLKRSYTQIASQQNLVEGPLLQKRNVIIGDKKKSRLIYHIMCSLCCVEFESTFSKRRFCSQSCATKYNWLQPEYRANITNQILEKVANGTHKGWQSRDKLKPSFPEKVVMEILDELNLSYSRELKVGRWFIDFAFPDKMIALEIDGKQHSYPERMIKDQEKDKFLIQNNWIVHRIKWEKITPEVRKKLKNKIQTLIGLL